MQSLGHWDSRRGVTKFCHNFMELFCALFVGAVGKTYIEVIAHSHDVAAF